LKYFLKVYIYIIMVQTHKQQFNKRHGFEKDEPHSLAEISKISKIKKSILQEVYNRGTGAFKTAGPSRPNMTIESWSQARVYAFVNKIEKGIKLNHDTDLFDKL